MLEDFKACEHCRALKPEEGIRGEYYRQGFRMSGKMAVIKMSDGGVLLFNPVRISEEVRRASLLTAPFRRLVAPVLSCHSHNGPSDKATL